MSSRRRLEDWHHMVVMIAVMVAISGGLAYLFLHVDLIPDAASVERTLIDRFVKVLFAIAGVVFGVVVTVFGYALLFFRRAPGDESDARPIRGMAALELTWTAVPLIIVIMLSYHAGKVLDAMMAADLHPDARQTVYSLGAFVPGKIAPSDTSMRELVVDIEAKRFIWRFGYPQVGIDSTYELVLPVNRRAVLRLRSEDVIHSFWVQQWGPKQDAVPGLSPVLRITPTRAGEFVVQCSQLCGFGHTDMTAPVRVVTADEFEKWAERQRSVPRASSPPAGSHVMIELTARNMAFDKSSIAVPAGVMVMISFHNADKGVPHNFAAYMTPEAREKIFVGDVITGPRRITYSFMAPKTPGSYFFRCDVHPTTMTGTLAVK